MSAPKEPTAILNQGPELSDDRDRKGPNVGADDVVTGSDSALDEAEEERRRVLSALTPDEEKKLLRRIDWHLIPLCSLIFMFKNLDVDNVRRPSMLRLE
jgi:hypothetical protein